MNDCNYTVRFISNITSGECPDDFWTSRSVSDNVSMADSFTEKIVGGGMMIKVKSGKKMEQIPAVLGEWTARKLYCVPGVSIKSLSTQIGINSNYLSFYFNHVLGANFHQWLYTLRIEEAKQIILHNPGVKISEVASAVGIPVIYNFSRWFKSITGMTAVTWRNMCRTEIAENATSSNQ